MKRISALILVLSIMFALCGCGSRALTDAEKEAIYEEIKQQKEVASASEQEYDIIVEDCAFAWEASNYIAIKPRVHNCTENDASYLSLNCELIDKAGKTIRVTTCDTGGLAAGANEWVGGIIEIPKDEIDDLAEIKFSGGNFDISKDGHNFRQVVRFAETSFSKEYVIGE